MAYGYGGWGDGEVLSPEQVQAELALAAGQRYMQLARSSGYDEGASIGYGHDYIGAPMGMLPMLRSGPAGGSLLSRAMRAPMMAHTSLIPQVRAAAPGPVDISPLPIDSGADIAAGGIQVINIPSNTIFKPIRLNIPDAIGGFFLVSDFNVGNVPLFAAAGDIPASVFTQAAVEANVRKVTANPGVPISIRVTNIDGAAHRFRAACFGYSSQPDGRCG